MKSLERLRADGLLASDAAVASVLERFGVPGSGDSARIWEAVVGDGLRFEVLADRGFDIGTVEFRGTPVSWRSPISDGRALSAPRGLDWLDRFTGGLLVTCGLRTIGYDERMPLHGDINHRPASNIRSMPSRGRARVDLAADIDSESVFGAGLRMERLISSGCGPGGSAWLEVEDEIVNTSSLPADVNVLYHLNFGAPMIVPGAYVEVDGTQTHLREGSRSDIDPGRLPEPVDYVDEAVFLHEGATHARIGSYGELSVHVEWSTDTLPYLHQWILPTRGRWALAIEPATTPMWRPAGRTDVIDRQPLGPGDRQVHRVRLSVGERS